MSDAWNALVGGRTPTVEQMRAGWKCPACGQCRATDFGPDPCFGELPGVDFACCGHGGLPGTTAIGTGYIRFTNGLVLRFNGEGVTTEKELTHGCD